MSANTQLIVCRLIVLAAFAPAAAADTVIYRFAGVNSAAGGDGQKVAFTYMTSEFVRPSPSTKAPFIALVSSQLKFCTNCQVSTSVPAVVFQPSSEVLGDQIDIGDNRNNGSVFSFPRGAFTAPGTYYSTFPFHPGTLVVSCSSSFHLRNWLTFGISRHHCGLQNK